MNKNTPIESPLSDGAFNGKSGRRILHLPSKGDEACDAQSSPMANAGNKFASCEDGGVPDNEPAAKTAEAGGPDASDKIVTADAFAISAPTEESEKSPPAKTALEMAIDRLTALGDKSDTMVVTKWGKRNAPILTESLSFLEAYAAASEAERKAVRKSLKAKSGVSREPNVDNLPVIAVYMGVSCTGKERTKAQRKEWCRFATVVKVAASASIKPEDAAEWLEKKTLKGILADWRDMQKAAGKGARRPGVPKALKDYAHLAVALAKGSKFLVLANEELAKADAAVGKAMSEAAATPDGAGAVAEEATANA